MADHDAVLFDLDGVVVDSRVPDGRIHWQLTDEALFTLEPAGHQKEPDDHPDDDCVQEGEWRRQQVQDDADGNETPQPGQRWPERLAPSSTFAF